MQPKQWRRKLLSEWPQRLSSTLVSIFSKGASASLHELFSLSSQLTSQWISEHLIYFIPCLSCLNLTRWKQAWQTLRYHCVSWFWITDLHFWSQSKLLPPVQPRQTWSLFLWAISRCILRKSICGWWTQWIGKRCYRSPQRRNWHSMQRWHCAQRHRGVKAPGRSPAKWWGLAPGRVCGVKWNAKNRQWPDQEGASCYKEI